MSIFTPKKKSLISKINIQEFYQKQIANQNCADCNLPMPKFVSINNGIFICSNCAKIHQNLGYNISFIRSVENDFFDPYLTSFLEFGGNMNFLLNLSHFNIDVKTPIEIKYKTRACEYYRRLLKTKVECDDPPKEPNLENGKNECDNIEYFPEFKNYELFKGEIDDNNNNNEGNESKFGFKSIVKGSVGLMFSGVKFLGGLTMNGIGKSYNYFKNRSSNNNNNNVYGGNNNVYGNGDVIDFEDFQETKNGVVKNNNSYGNNNNNFSYNQNYNNNNNNFSYNQNYINNNNNFSYNQNYINNNNNNNYNYNFNNNNNINNNNINNINNNNNKYSTNHIYNNNIYSLNNEDNNNIYNNYPTLNNNNNNIFTINNKNPIINNNNNNNNKYPLYDSNNFKDSNNNNNNNNDNNIYIKNQPFIVTNESVQICEEEPINENMITSEEKFNPTCEYENTNKEKARKDANNFLLES